MRNTINDLAQISNPEEFVRLLKDNLTTLQNLARAKPADFLHHISKEFDDRVKELLKKAKPDGSLLIKYNELIELAHETKNAFAAFDRHNKSSVLKKRRKKSQQKLQDEENAKQLKSLRQKWISNPEDFLNKLSAKPENLIIIIQKEFLFLEQFVGANPIKFLEYANSKFNKFIQEKYSQKDLNIITKDIVCRRYTALYNNASKACENRSGVKLNLEANPRFQKRQETLLKRQTSKDEVMQSQTQGTFVEAQNAILNEDTKKRTFVEYTQDSQEVTSKRQKTDQDSRGF